MTQAAFATGTIGLRSPEAHPGGTAAAELRQFVERIERPHEERDALGADLKDVYAELKGRGYDAKAVKRIVALRKKDANERDEEAALLDLYMHALGMV